MRSRAHRMCSQTGRVGDEIHRDDGACISLIAVLILRSESSAAARATQSSNTGETMIVKDHDVELHALLQRSDDLLGHHEVGAVSHKNVNFAARVGHLDSEAARDLVAHAGIAVLHVVILGIASTPEFMQIAGETARGTDDYVAWAERGVQQPDHLSLTERRTITARVDSVDFRHPLAAQTRYLGGVAFRHTIR